MRTKHIHLIALLFVVFTILFTPAVKGFAQEPTPSDDEVNAIARQLYCPVCENTPLDVCPTTACHQWRELIRQMLAEGKSAAEIKQYFVDYYGARVLSEPPRTGINWMAYIVPPVVFLAGATLLFLAFRTWTRMPKDLRMRTNQIPSPESNLRSSKESGFAPGDEYVARLEDELKKRK